MFKSYIFFIYSQDKIKYRVTGVSTKRKFNINPARQTNGNLCNKSMFRRKCRYFKAFRFPPSLFHRAPLPNSFVLNINYFPTTLEMLPAVDLPTTTRKSKKQQYVYIRILFQGYVKFQRKRKKLSPPLLRSILYYILYTSFVDYTSSTCSVCNVEQVVFFDTPQWTFPFVSLSNTYEITTRALETDNFGSIFSPLN